MTHRGEEAGDHTDLVEVRPLGGQLCIEQRLYGASCPPRSILQASLAILQIFLPLMNLAKSFQISLINPVFIEHISHFSWTSKCHVGRQSHDGARFNQW